MTAKMAPNEALSTMLISRWEQIGGKLAALADEFPAGKYESAPAEGVRTFGDVLRHVAFWNLFVADSARGRKADDTANELPKRDYATKQRIVEALRQSTADAAAALREPKTVLSAETTEMLVSFIEHTCEHYGQLVVYARVNGIVPPASRT